MKPLLALKCPPEMSMDEFIDQLKYPLLATPKIDGIRCMVEDGWSHTRSLKPIPNTHVREQLNCCPPWLDGELSVGSTFQACTSGIMSHHGVSDFTYWVFDAEINLGLDYERRTTELARMWLPPFCKKLLPRFIHNRSELEAYEKEVLSNGAEGVMLRPPTSPYWQKRSSFRHPYLIAIKRFVDDEAVIIGFDEQMENCNPQFTNELGFSDRSSHQENLVPKNTLGALVVEHPIFGVFRIGTGFDDSFRLKVWKDRDCYANRKVKFKYQPVGIKDKPRSPVFLGFRDQGDLS